MRSKTSASLMLVLTFLLGAVAGAIALHLYQSHFKNLDGRQAGHQGPHDIVEEMGRNLKLNPDQKDKLKIIIQQSRERYRALSTQFRPQYDVIRNETNEQIRKILTEEQKATFERTIKEMEERRKSRDRSQRP